MSANLRSRAVILGELALRRIERALWAPLNWTALTKALPLGIIVQNCTKIASSLFDIAVKMLCTYAQADETPVQHLRQTLPIRPILPTWERSALIVSIFLYILLLDNKKK